VRIITHRSRNFAATLDPVADNFVVFVFVVELLGLDHCFQGLRELILFFTLA
jgi:hypothetical protein